MDDVALLLLALFAVGFFAIALPIAMVVLFARLKRVESEVREIRGLLAVREVAGAQVREAREAPVARDTPEVRAVPTTPAVEVRDVPERRDVADAAEAQAAPVVPHAPVPASAPVAAAAPVATQAPVTAAESLETRIGSRWLLYIGVIAIVIGAAYFEKLAIDYGWIGEGARVIQGAVVGLALIGAGLQFSRRGYAVYGQVLAGGGGAILYLSTYAAFNFYALIGRPLALGLMVVITLLIAWLADRQRSQGLALFAVGGGFATPFLFPGTTDAQIALFTYVAILIGGTMLLSRRREWPFLHLVSYLCTLLTVAAWSDRFYTDDKYLRTELYLTLYCAMFLYIANQCRRAATDAGRLVWLLLCTAPVAYYLASLAILTNHSAAMLIWLVLVMLTGAVATTRTGPNVGIAVWTAVTFPLLIWCATPVAQGMRRDGLVAIAAVYVIALLAELEGTILRDDPRPARVADVAWVHLNPLAAYAGAYVLMSPVSIDDSGYLAVAFAVWNASGAALLWRRHADLAVHFLGVAFTLLAIAIGLLFNGTAVTAGWAVEGAVVILLAIRQQRRWLHVAGVVLFVVAVAQTLDLLLSPAPASQIVLLNPRAACATLVIGLCYLLAWWSWRHTSDTSRRAGVAAALLTAQLVTLVALTGEINAFWAVRNGHLERELMLSVTWGLYATALVVIGLARGYAPIRYFAIGVLALTIAKVFFVDMAELDRIYRVGSVIALGVLLLVTSYLYSSRKAIDDPNGRV